ncbi:Ser/Thr protein kinase RdoA (MazF antagonist) [Paenibacillus sp. JGP012]|uniref:phosphotransferase n=1 Tax=Paenibacillus sp. JGP012 TaxID=2735914 RepID=UPI0016161641|nr:phosphotransferase [Paenibacillus sp. JGP012]MBB6024410.1 Ser/Thr protein kinase RdoA (MazF antagonist) [Paenibacillus sp. JGP012]
MFNQPTALRSVLSRAYLKWALQEHYDIGTWEECRFWLRGLNDTYRVRTSEGTFILRIYRTEVTEADVHYELDMLTMLQDHLKTSVHTGIGDYIRTKDQSGCIMIDAAEGKRAAVMFHYIEGVENNLEDEASCYAFGQSAAELHRAMDQIKLGSGRDHSRFELDTKFLIDEPLERIIRYIGESHEEAAFLRAFASTLKDQIQTVSGSGLDYGLCHGDMHGNNNVFQQQERFIHYDFEWAAPGWRAYDLAQVKIRKRQSGNPEQKQQLWEALMKGYRSVRSFTDADEQAVDLFIIARRFWVMGLDVAFIESDMGALDYGSDWLNDFVEEFRETRIVK